MRTTTKLTLAAAIVAVGALGTGAAVASSRVTADSSSERAAEASYTDAHRREARVSQAEAERIAQGTRPGRIVESHLETEGRGLRWEVKTDDGTTVWEIQIDPATGAVVGNQPDE